MSNSDPHRLHMACGSYDGTVFAMRYEHTRISEAGPTYLKAEFIDPDAHSGPVTALAVYGDTVASGGDDEAIKLFSLSRHCRTGCLELHIGTIRHLIFADSRHLLSAGEDACLAVWRRGEGSRGVDSWECIRQMRRHKAPPTAFALHPSARLAFSVADADNDHTFRIWNLTRGRQAYTTRLRSLKAEGTNSLAAVIVPEPPRHQHHLLLFLIVPPSSAHSHRLDILDLGEARQKALFTARFPTLLSVPPAVFYVEEEVLYLLAGIRNTLKAYKCYLTADKMELIAETRVPGKRFKFLKVLPWPEELTTSNPQMYGRKRRLVALVTTDTDGSYVRGYAADLEEISVPVEGAIPSLPMRPAFTYDIRDIRITQVDAAWTSTFNEASEKGDDCLFSAQGAEEDDDEKDENIAGEEDEESGEEESDEA